MAVSHSQHAVSPEFPVSQYDASEDQRQLLVWLSAPILTKPFAYFNGSIEVDIGVEDLPSSDTRKGAKFGKQ